MEQRTLKRGAIGGIKKDLNGEERERTRARLNHAEDLGDSHIRSSAWFETPRVKDAPLLTMKSFFIDT